MCLTERTTTVVDIARRLGVPVLGDEDVALSGITHHSASVRPGVLFCCVVGAAHDGHEFAADAVASGAVALLCSHPLPELQVPQMVVGDVRAVLGTAASTVLGDPSARLSVVGVTGTNGKTTVVSLVGDVLRRVGRSPAVVGTLTGARTTPEAPELQTLLASMVDDGVTDVAMEVSSHALVLGRVEAVDFAVGVFTNLGLDHLDFHGTPEAYFAAKAELFRPGRCRSAVINCDDVHGRLLVDSLQHEASVTSEVVGVSLDDLDALVVGPRSSSFTWRGEHVDLPLPGRHNVTNALLAAETCRLLGASLAAIAEALSTVRPVPGRFEVVSGATAPFVVAVDYAHTPDALRAVLGAAREMAGDTGRVLLVFGCGGDRDRSKRPEMGAVACELADLAVLTTDNPRSEPAAVIAAEVLAGCGVDDTDLGERLLDIPDRATAIATAIERALPSDVVLIAGKGHEKEQIVGSVVTPFDDVLVCADVLDRLGHDVAGSQRTGSA
ncbi:MAG: UDP-N-acetylmuramoyl-L-alanyl-D-glutamate--2,6-diaminopimelate ligase [Actinomycetes bacterium]